MKKIVIPGVIAVVVLIVVIVSFSGGGSTVIYTRPHQYDSDYLKEVKKHEKDMLSNYKLIDTAHQIYSIPIDSAIEEYTAENK
jgi:hypothetical protein